MSRGTPVNYSYPKPQKWVDCLLSKRNASYWVQQLCHYHIWEFMAALSMTVWQTSSPIHTHREEWVTQTLTLVLTTLVTPASASSFSLKYRKIPKISRSMYKPPKPVTQKPSVNRPSKYKRPRGLYLENYP